MRNPTLETAAFLPLVQAIAREAGELQLRYFRRNYTIQEKGSASNIVTEADLAVEELVVARIRETYPDHNFLGEEGRYEKTGSDWTWILDPIDGTTNFSKGLDHFCLSLALAWQGEIVLGLVFNPARDEMFWALKGQGAFLNGMVLEASRESRLEKALLVTGFSYDRGESVTRTLAQIQSLFDAGIMGVRRFGSAALDLCYVAAGRFDAYWELLLHPWDFAAGLLIAREAGARVLDTQGAEASLQSPGLLAAAPGLAQELCRRLRYCEP